MDRFAPTSFFRFAALAVFLAWLPLACTSSDRAAQEVFELAQFEERQGNLDHARRLYGDILARYPETEWARKAQERIAAVPPADASRP